MGRDTMGTTARNVWLPNAGVWAWLPQSSDAVGLREGDPSPSPSVEGNIARCDDCERHEKHARTRGSPSASCSRRDSGFNAEDSSEKPKSFSHLHAEVDESGSGFRVESVACGIRGEDQGASSSQEVMCPICLGNIDKAGEAILQWCMHRFCTNCIEEWSRVRRVCPLCKAEYRGWYHSVQSNNKFQEILLPSIVRSSTQHSRGDTAARRQVRGRGRRPLQSRRQGAPDSAPSRNSQTFGRSVPLPTQRSFGLPGQHQGAQAMRILEEKAAAGALQWRRSIYDRKLKARPFEIGRRFTCTQDAKARAERRLGPWIRRELQAVLPNSDHEFLVRLVLGHWFGAENEVGPVAHRQWRSSVQQILSTGTAKAKTEVEGAGEKATKELERFLGDKAELFWHELRCFAESPFTMQAYDIVAVYTGRENLRSPNNRADENSLHQDSTQDSRRRSESSVSRSTSRPLDQAGAAHLDNNQKRFRAGRHSNSRSCAAESVLGSLGQLPRH